MKKVNLTGVPLRIFKKIFFRFIPGNPNFTPLIFIFFLTAIILSCIFVYQWISGTDHYLSGRFLMSISILLLFMIFCEALSENNDQ